MPTMTQLYSTTWRKTI